jgi:hypothetical protein
MGMCVSDGFGSVAVIIHDDLEGSLDLFDELRQEHIPAAIFHDGVNMQTQVQMAMSSMSCVAVFIAQGQDLAVVKDLGTGKFEKVRQTKLIPYLRRRVAKFMSEAGYKEFNGCLYDEEDDE